MDALQVFHDTEIKRFKIGADEDYAYLAYDKVGDDIIEFTHTYVPEAFRGQGVAVLLIEAALDHARKNNLKVKPSCAYAAKYLGVEEGIEVAV